MRDVVWRGLIGGLLAIPGAASAAEPLFVPDFTPGSANEFAIGVMVQGMVTDKLLEEGHIVLGSEVVATVVGSEAITNCAVVPTCPQQVLPKIPTRVAIVGRLNRAGETLVGHVELYEQSNPNPLQVLDVPMAAGNEHLFAAEVAKATNALLQQIGPSPDEVLMAAARLIAGQAPAAVPAPQPVPVPAPAATAAPPPPAPAPAPAVPPPAPIVDLDSDTEPAVPVVRQKKGDGTQPHTQPLDEILKDTGVARRHLVGTEQHFIKSGLDPRDYLYRTMPHAGRLTFEIRAGLGMGDIDRAVKMRVETRQGDQTNAFYDEGPSAARNIRGSAYIGYAPATMIDIGVLAGLQYGQRYVTTGLSTVDLNGVLVDQTTVGPTQLQALNFYVQPRLRGYLVPIGPAKPFLFTGAEFKIFDRYQIEQPVDVTYPVPQGGVVPGWVGGGGMMIDPGPIVGFFAEFSYARHFGSRAVLTHYSQAGEWPHPYEPLPAATQATMAINGGVQFRL